MRSGTLRNGEKNQINQTAAMILRLFHHSRGMIQLHVAGLFYPQDLLAPTAPSSI